MLQVKKYRQTVRQKTSVLIQGETGTEKRRRPGHSLRKSLSDAPVHLAELFLPYRPAWGKHLFERKGSYTGAVSSKGLFELARRHPFPRRDQLHGLRPPGKNLKAIEDRQVRRIGGHELIPIDVRIVAAINEDPFTAIRASGCEAIFTGLTSIPSTFLPEGAKGRYRLCDRLLHRLLQSAEQPVTFPVFPAKPGFASTATTGPAISESCAMSLKAPSIWRNPTPITLSDIPPISLAAVKTAISSKAGPMITV